MEKHQEYISKIVNRFSNPYISDEVTRVGRSPIRKLGPNDRLISPAKQFAEIVGDQPVYLAKSIAAALLYDYPQDAEAVEIQESIKNNGLELTIEKYTQLDSDSNLAKLIVEQYNSFKGGKL